MPLTRLVTAPLVAHILHRFDTGGLENGVVNLINHFRSCSRSICGGYRPVRDQ